MFDIPTQYPVKFKEAMGFWVALEKLIPQYALDFDGMSSRRMGGFEYFENTRFVLDVYTTASCRHLYKFLDLFGALL